MSLSRRDALRLGAAVIGSGMAMTGSIKAAELPGDRYMLAGTEVVIHPVNHASFVMALDGMILYNDPVGPVAAYQGLPAPDLILITHQHGDHYSPETLAGLVADRTRVIVNPAVFDMLPAGLRARATSLANGKTTKFGALTINALPAYNLAADRLQYHPRGRDNGYVLSLAGGRIYIAGDTEDTPEMRALSGIDIAFLPMNLPYTMTIEQAAAAVAAFRPEFVYPYHYRGSDTDAFARLVEQGGVGTKAVLRDWYG